MKNELVEGDTGSVLQLNFTDSSGKALDLTGASVNLFWSISNGAPQTRPMAIANDPTTGVATYQFQPGDLTVGNMVGEGKIVQSDNTVLSQTVTFSVPIRAGVCGDQVPLLYVPNSIASKNNGESVALPQCTPVYLADDGKIYKTLPGAGGAVGCDGLVADAFITPGSSGNYVTSGPLSTTTAAWDAVTGDTGGLVSGDIYYASSTIAGKLTKTKPVAGGTYSTAVGMATSSTVLEVGKFTPVAN